ncbi:hypothetical protein DAEQUDRAFT_684524, partial [Daedalea quercina L-15889]
MEIEDGGDNGNLESGEPEENEVANLQNATAEARAGAWVGHLRQTTVEDVTESDDEDNVDAGGDDCNECSLDDHFADPLAPVDEGEDYNEEFWNEYVDEVMVRSEDRGGSEEGLSAWDQLGVEFEAENRPTYESLSEPDKATLRLFALKTDEHLTRKTLNKLPYAFPGSSVPSTDRMRTHIAFLSGIKPVKYDCCINSCCCFVGPHAELDTCPYCREARRNSSGKARRQFSYIPIKQRLQAFAGNMHMATQMRHRAYGHQHNPNKIADIYDSSAYCSKLNQHVRIHDRMLRHTHFSDARDVALGLATDGFGPFRCRNKTC